MREFDYKLFHILTSKFLIKPNFRNANLLNSCTADTGIWLCINECCCTGSDWNFLFIM